MINSWSDELKDFFSEEINKIWNGEDLPEEYREVSIKTILLLLLYYYNYVYFGQSAQFRLFMAISYLLIRNLFPTTFKLYIIQN